MVNAHALLLESLLLLPRLYLPPHSPGIRDPLGSPLMLVARSMAACWASALPDGTSPPLGTDDCSNRKHLSFASHFAQALLLTPSAMQSACAWRRRW